MKSYRRTAILWLTLALLATPVSSWITLGSSAYLYLYGATWCPYCRALDEFFSKTYVDSYYYCKIDVSEECRRAFDSLMKIISARVPPEYREYLGSIPQTYVVRDGRYLIAIVIGAVTDARFWRNVSSIEPRERVLLILPPRAHEIPMSFAEQSDLVSKYVLVSRTAVQPGWGPVLSPQTLVPLALVAAGGALMAYAFARRRK